MHETEMLDIVDENDNVIGRDTRHNIHRSKSWHRGIHVLVFNRDGEMLLQLRGPDRDKYPNTFDLSVSEHAKAGESYDHAAKRGLLEELGIGDAEPERILRLRMEYGPRDWSITVLYKLVYEGKMRMDRKETASIQFFPVDEVRKMLGDEKEKFSSWTYEILRWYFGLPSKLIEIDRYG
jgi:isopentenyl-diphosphate delta-isomerase